MSAATHHSEAPEGFLLPGRFLQIQFMFGSE